ncbi:hypothetical protein ACFFJN_07685, partial [Erwinia mallotivora]|uniref:hypothetical protein n=1 Tax=Erwinia mallotivora TaxID=69222 RepID=UPI0035E791D9
EFIANLPFTACHTLPSEIIVMHYTITPFGMSSKYQAALATDENDCRNLSQGMLKITTPPCFLFITRYFLAMIE